MCATHLKSFLENIPTHDFAVEEVDELESFTASEIGAFLDRYDEEILGCLEVVKPTMFTSSDIDSNCSSSSIDSPLSFWMSVETGTGENSRRFIIPGHVSNCGAKAIFAPRACPIASVALLEAGVNDDNDENKEN